VSGEPAAAPIYASAWRDGGEFVIQEHAARRHHFDLRLELNGVLKSWAVPKEIPFEPGAKALALEVEDHPVDYATFEGVIPAGQYGAGAVLIWDRGSYRVETGTAEEAFRAGKLPLVLHGTKCAGRWTLVRMRRGREAENRWLLIKNRDLEEPRRQAIGGWNRSVASGRTIRELGAAPRPPGRRRPPRD
jgi:bifunctional non-homologous end joining protein LigD